MLLRSILNSFVNRATTDALVAWTVPSTAQISFCRVTKRTETNWFIGLSNNNPTCGFWVFTDAVLQLCVALQLEFEGSNFKRSQRDRDFTIFHLDLFQIVL